MAKGVKKLNIRKSHIWSSVSGIINQRSSNEKRHKFMSKFIGTCNIYLSTEKFFNINLGFINHYKNYKENIEKNVHFDFLF